MAARGGAIVNIADLAGLGDVAGVHPARVVEDRRDSDDAIAREDARADGSRERGRARRDHAARGLASRDVGERLRQTTPLKRLGSANNVAGAVIYLLEADYVTGETIVVDGGRHVRR